MLEPTSFTWSSTLMPDLLTLHQGLGQRDQDITTHSSNQMEQLRQAMINKKSDTEQTSLYHSE